MDYVNIGHYYDYFIMQYFAFSHLLFFSLHRFYIAITILFPVA